MAIETPYRFKSQELQNNIINGNFDFWQRGTSFALTPNQTAYTADRVSVSNIVPSGNVAIARSTDVPTLAVGATYSSLFTQSTAATFAAGSYVIPYDHRIEGLNYRNVHQKIVTISFWFKASVAGTYCLAIRNGAANRSYVTNFTVTSATWTQVTKTIALDTVGTFNLDNTIGCYVTIGANTGLTFQTATVDAWQAGNYFSSSSATNWNGTAGATVQISQVMFNAGPTAATFAGFAADYSGEFRACQRYYEKSYNLEDVPGSNTSAGRHYGLLAAGIATGNGYGHTIFYRVDKRTNAAAVFYDSAGVINRVFIGATSVTTGATYLSARSATPINSSGTSQGAASVSIEFQWTADAEL